MKIWVPEVIPVLPDKLLSALHRDVCALRGESWGVKSHRVSYLWNHPFAMLSNYHKSVLREMFARGWSPDTHWLVPGYRGMAHKMLPLEECDWNGNPHPFPEHTPRLIQKHRKDLYRRVIETIGPWSPEDILRVEKLAVLL